MKPDFVVLRAEEAQTERLEAMGYRVEQLELVEPYLSTFATEAAGTGFHTVETLEQDLRRLAEEHPEIAELRRIGQSVEGRPLWALRIGERRDSTRSVAFLGCHHAREWISVEIPYLLAEHLLDNSTTDPVSRWLSHGEVWVVPMVNPDGHEHTRTENRLWRKNRRRNSGGSIGVDPNRNYGYMWGVLDISTSSHVPSDETYVGPRAFSEPEVRAVRDLVARELFDGVLSYHSYSQLVLFPWGYTSEPIEDEADRDGMRTLAERMEALIRSVHGETCRPRSSTRPRGTPPTGPTASSASPRSRSSCGRPPRWRAGSCFLQRRSGPAGRRIGPRRSSSSGTCSRARRADRPSRPQEVRVGRNEQTWIARLTPLSGGGVPGLLAMPLGVDVWERQPGFLVVAAAESRLAEIERRRLARVERLVTTERYEVRMAEGTTGGRLTEPAPRSPTDAVGGRGASVGRVRLPDGLVAVVKRDCPTCVLVEPVLRELGAAVWCQDDAGWFDGDDTELELSYRLGIETVPTLMRVEGGAETGAGRRLEPRAVGAAHRGRPGSGATLPDHRPGCGSLSVDPFRIDALEARYGGSGLGSRRVELADAEDEHEALFDRGWTDGLPVVPPTPERVLRMLRGTTRAPRRGGGGRAARTSWSAPSRRWPSTR